MTATVAMERQQAEINQELGPWAVFQGRNFIRFIIAGWPKIAQQFVGLTVFNTYAVYFCKWKRVDFSLVCFCRSNSTIKFKMQATKTLSSSLLYSPVCSSSP